jgi:deoxyribose-phosphate aldolase
VRVATVVNFPNGTEPLPDVLRAVAQALLDGTDEIDLVLPYRALAAGDLDQPVHMIRAVRSAMPGILKIILETGELANPMLIEQAAHIAIEHGADFIKTSTGKTRVGATLSATALMLDVIRRTNRPVGLKPSGGIRTFDEAMAYIDQAESVMGAGWPTPSTFRFGASGLLNAFEAAATDSVRTESSNDGY